MGRLNGDCQRDVTRDSSKSWLSGAENGRVRPFTERPGGVPFYIQLIRLSTTHRLTGASKCIERRRDGRREGGGERWGTACGLLLEIRESRGNIATAMNTIPLPVIAHAAPVTSLAANPRVPSGRQPPLLLPSYAGRPRRVVVRDPRLTRARPLFSTPLVLCWRVPVCHSVCHSIAVVCRPPPRVADAVIVGPRIVADKTGGRRGGERGLFNARAREPRRRSRRPVICASELPRVSPVDNVSRKNVWSYMDNAQIRIRFNENRRTNRGTEDTVTARTLRQAVRAVTFCIMLPLREQRYR